MLKSHPSLKRTRPLTSLAVSSARRPKPLTTFAIGPSFGKPTLPRPPCWTRRLGLIQRAFSPPVRAILLRRLRLPLPLTILARCFYSRIRWSCFALLPCPALPYSLLSLPPTRTANVDGEAPPLSDVLADSPSQPPLASGVV